ncbi:MAG: cobalamin B12-binding domain-containing protein [Planctomycetes bacterium]|nr:cobalamin B12-binding domain-containing protein [Planctomycetota bacterium]
MSAPSQSGSCERTRIVLATSMPDSDVTHGLAMRTLKSYLAHRGPADAVEVTLRTFSLRAREDAVAAEIMQSRPHIVGFSRYVWNGTHLNGVVRKIRESAPSCPLLLAGGPDVAHDPARSVGRKGFDVVVLGEGEEAFRRIVEIALAGSSQFDSIPNIVYRKGDSEIVTTRPAPEAFEDISSHDFPLILDADDHRMFRYETSRGCHFRCRYCKWDRSGARKIRYYPIEKVKGDLERIFALPRLAVLELVDSTFFRPRDKARGLEIMETIHRLNAGREASGLAPVGVVTEQNHLFLDAETCATLSRLPLRNGGIALGLQTIDAEVNQKVLGRGFNRRTSLHRIAELSRDLGSRLAIDVIYGLPGEGYGGYRRSLAFVLTLRTAHIGMYHFLVLPGTHIADHAAQYGIRYETVSPHRLLSSSTWSREDLLEAAKLSFAVYLFYCEDVVPQLNPVRRVILDEVRGNSLPVFDDLVRYLQAEHRPLFSRWLRTFQDSMLDGLTDAYRFFVRTENGAVARRILSDAVAIAKAHAER